MKPNPSSNLVHAVQLSPRYKVLISVRETIRHCFESNRNKLTQSSYLILGALLALQWMLYPITTRVIYQLYPLLGNALYTANNIKSVCNQKCVMMHIAQHDGATVCQHVVSLRHTVQGYDDFLSKHN
ncbi:hypothetical protein GQX74_007542 [Glossina fuscipes]|nr:hypothetical protein GQX74_007542 [Glossina fuscipes]